MELSPASWGSERYLCTSKCIRVPREALWVRDTRDEQGKLHPQTGLSIPRLLKRGYRGRTERLGGYRPVVVGVHVNMGSRLRPRLSVDTRHGRIRPTGLVRSKCPAGKISKKTVERYNDRGTKFGNSPRNIDSFCSPSGSSLECPKRYRPRGGGIIRRDGLLLRVWSCRDS